MKWLAILYFFSFSVLMSGQTAQTGKVPDKNYIIYNVQPGDGWYGIARKFNISYAELRLANKNHDDKLVIGSAVLIPAKLNPSDPHYDKNYFDQQKSNTSAQPRKQHIVQKSQTLYSVSKLYDVSVDELKLWNNLPSNAISIGQKLFVSPEIVAAPSPPVPAPKSSPVPEKKDEPVVENLPLRDTVPLILDTQESVDTSEEVLSDTIAEEKIAVTQKRVEPEKKNTTDSTEVVFGRGREQTVENGTAEILDEAETKQEKYYALHREAPIGTVIRVLNMSNSRKIFVKVTGRMNDDADESTLIQLSPRCGEKLSASGKYFKVNLLYGVDANANKQEHD